MNWSQHLILVPVLLPMLCGALLILINEKRHGLKFSINMVSVLLLLGNAMLLLWLTNSGYWSDSIGVYLSGNWVAPFGISLVIDRLAALMLVLTAFLSAASLLYAMQGWSRIGVHFHSMFQFLLMGLNGAFLTGDLFNLFVFFELLLPAPTVWRAGWTAPSISRARSAALALPSAIAGRMPTLMHHLRISMPGMSASMVA